MIPPYFFSIIILLPAKINRYKQIDKNISIAFLVNYDIFMLKEALRGNMIMQKVTWGVLGTAGIAKGCTIPGMQQAENCRLYAIASRSAQKAEAFKETFGFEKAYGSYAALLADPEVEAVYIPLPNDMHYDWVLKALKAGKHVLCEKPLAPTVSQIKQMFQVAKENNVLLMEAFAYLHSPIVSAVKQEIEDGKLGQIRYMESAFITSDYDIRNIRMRKETFGGATYDLGCYNTSQILWMLGEEPERVQAVADFSEEGVDMCTTGLLSFASGAKATFQCAMVLETDADRRIDRFQIHGTLGEIRSEARFNQDGNMTYTIRSAEETTVKTVSARQNYALEVEQFGRCITQGENPHVSEDFSLMNARVLERVLSAIAY